MYSFCRDIATMLRDPLLGLVPPPVGNPRSIPAYTRSLLPTISVTLVG